MGKRKGRRGEKYKKKLYTPEQITGTFFTKGDKHGTPSFVKTPDLPGRRTRNFALIRIQESPEALQPPPTLPRHRLEPLSLLLLNLFN